MQTQFCVPCDLTATLSQAMSCHNNSKHNSGLQPQTHTMVPQGLLCDTVRMTNTQHGLLCDTVMMTNKRL
jgi:hypothetical protein